MAVQEGDVLLFNESESGEILIENGLMTMTGGFETAAYLSLFGGNRLDDGRAENNQSYWYNYLVLNPNETKIVSKTQYLLDSLPITIKNMLSLEDAAKSDLQWFLDYSIADTVDVSIRLIERNVLEYTINISANGIETSFNFTENWKAAGA